MGGSREEVPGGRPDDPVPTPSPDGGASDTDRAGSGKPGSEGGTEHERARIERDAGDVADDLADFA